MAFLAAFAFFALGYLAQDVVMSSLDCTTPDSWSQETTDLEPLEPWCIFQVIYSDSRAPIFLVRYPYHYLCFLSIGQFHVKKSYLRTDVGINLNFRRFPGVENSIETDIIENANFAFEGYFGNKTLDLAGSGTWFQDPYLVTLKA